MNIKTIITNPGTPEETRFTLRQLGDQSWSLTGPAGSDADQLNWPTDEQCSKAAGVSLVLVDAGDDPVRPEAILHARPR